MKLILNWYCRLSGTIVAKKIIINAPTKSTWMNLGFPLALTVWKVSKYGVFSGPYFPVFGLNTGKYGPEKTTHLDTYTFHAVWRR